MRTIWPERRSTLTLSLALLATALTAAPLAAQTPTAHVTGFVQDSAARPLAGVEVRAANLKTGFEYQARTSTTGRYWLRGLPPGSYDLTARRIGMRPTTVSAVELAIGRTFEIDFTLQLSAVEVEPLRVGIAAPLIETTEAEISYVLEHRQIERLPEESRQFLDLANLVPGATRGTADATGGTPSFGTTGVSVGGLSQKSLGILVDGGDFTEGLFGDPAGSVPLLAIQEFEVIHSQYSADMGRAASGIVSVVTRRGGNDFVIEGLGLYRHHALNARGAFEAEKPDFNRLHWGVALGGPIVAGRTQFFTAFERRVQNNFSTVNTGGALPELEGSFETPFTDNLMFARIDHRVSDAHELTLRYSGEIGEEVIDVGGGLAFDYGRTHSLDMHSVMLTHRWALGGSWLNEARLHFIDSRRSLERVSSPGPTLVYQDIGASAGPNEAEERNRSARLEMRDDLSWIASGSSGTHRLRFGAQLSWLQYEVASYFFADGLFRFARHTDSLPAFAQATFKDGPELQLNTGNVQLAAYVQDDWTPVRGLTLNLGLRYEVETNGSNQNWVSPFAGELPFIRTTEQPIDANNLSPRVGIAWDPFGRGRTVLRGGFGTFYDAFVAGPLLALERSSGVPLLLVPNPGTTDVDELDPAGARPVIWANGDIDTPMTRQYSLGVAQTLPGDVLLRVDGLLVEGRNLLVTRNLNPILPGAGPVYPDFALVHQELSEGRVDAAMLMVWVHKAFPGGWIDLGYTLADRKSTHDSRGRPFVPQTDPDMLDLDLEWGPAAWDERHRLTVTGGLTLPHDLGLTAKLVYASARPFTAITGRDDNGDADGTNDRPPGEGRNARRGPDFFQTDLGLTWGGLSLGPTRLGVVLNVYNLFDTTNGEPESVLNVIGTPGFGQPRAAFPGRQVEVGVQVGGL